MNKIHDQLKSPTRPSLTPESSGRPLRIWRSCLPANVLREAYVVFQNAAFLVYNSESSNSPYKNVNELFLFLGKQQNLLLTFKRERKCSELQLVFSACDILQK